MYKNKIIEVKCAFYAYSCFYQIIDFKNRFIATFYRR